MRLLRILLKYLLVAPIITIVFGWVGLLLVTVNWVLEGDPLIAKNARSDFRKLWAWPTK